MTYMSNRDPQQDDWLFLHSCSWCLSPDPILQIKPAFYGGFLFSACVRHWLMFHSPVPDLFEDFKVSDRQAVVWRRTTRRFSRYGMTNGALYRVHSAFCCFLIKVSPPEWPLQVGLTLTRNQWRMEKALLTVFCAAFDIWTTESLGGVYQVETLTATSVSLRWWLFLCFLPLGVALKTMRIVCVGL